MPDKNTVYRFLDEDVSDIYAELQRDYRLRENFHEAMIASPDYYTVNWTVVISGGSEDTAVANVDSPVCLALATASGASPTYVYIISKQIFNCNPSAFTAQKQRYSKLTLRFYAQFVGTTGYTLDENVLGFNSVDGGSVPTPAIEDIAIFFLKDVASVGVLYARTDSNGTDEETDVSSGITLTDWNKYTIEVTSASVKFYINDVLKATHATQKPLTPAAVALKVAGAVGAVVGLNIAGAYARYEV